MQKYDEQGEVIKATKERMIEKFKHQTSEKLVSLNCR